MKIIDVEQGTDEWKELRLGKIRGTNLGDIWAAKSYNKKDMVEVLSDLGADFKKSLTIAQLEEIMPDEAREELLKRSPRKLGFYEVIAERLGLPRDDENRMDRGSRLEADAREWFEKEYKVKVDEVGICVSDADDRIINSPDGLIKDENGEYTMAYEAKCLSPARHIQAVVENKIPDEYFTQKLQYFVTNEKLQKLYWHFHDPSLTSIPNFVVEVNRADLGDWPERLLEFQLSQLRIMDEIVEELAF
jgi:hypothetical protein